MAACRHPEALWIRYGSVQPPSPRCDGGRPLNMPSEHDADLLVEALALALRLDIDNIV